MTEKLRAHLYLLADMDTDRRSFCRGLVALGLVSGAIGRAEIAKAAMEASAGNVEFFLSRGIEFFNGEDLTSLRRSDVQRLSKLPLKLPSWLNEGLTLTSPNDDDVVVNVTTCEGYWDAIERGFYARSTFDMKMEGWLATPSAILKAVDIGQPPRVSFLTGLSKGRGLFPIVHASVAQIMGEPEVPADARTLEELVQRNLANPSDAKGDEAFLAFEFGGMERLLFELMRADLNGDGIEEVLVFDYVNAPEGTLGFCSIGLVTRGGPSDLIDVVPWRSEVGMTPQV